MSIPVIDVKTESLQGSNLIEASAGTGKTYSIAILVLRLILEKEMQIKEILMVTFTKAAVAELEERIRLFIHNAGQVADEQKIEDENITEVVEAAIEKEGRQKVQEYLRDAQLFLDETSIMTIHSFCQRILTEFAFETGQLFGAETLKDMSTLLEEEVNRFWRTEVATLDVGLLTALKEGGLNRDLIKKVVQAHLSGKRYFTYDERIQYCLELEEQLAYGRVLVPKIEVERKTRKAISAYYDAHRDTILAATADNKQAQRHIGEKALRKDEFLQHIWKSDAGYIKEAYKELYALSQPGKEAKAVFDTSLQDLFTRLFCMAIQAIGKAVPRYKTQHNLLSFDDMIENLETALYGARGSDLTKSLQAKFRAVFVDEFQDTDKLQYRIFDKAFPDPTLLFYIGDPKQSIYGWRKADIQTYFSAAAGVQRRFTLDKNYRSSRRMIAAMNHFFYPQDGFNTFHSIPGKVDIHYREVHFPEKSSKGELYFQGKQEAPITIFRDADQDAIYATVVAQIRLLLDSYQIEEKGARRSVLPSDIGIVVRKNKEAAALKRLLTQQGLPAVTIDETKVLRSEEASHVLYLLEAFEQVSHFTIHRALLSPFTGFTKKDVLSLNEDAAIERFRTYNKLWLQEGVFSALRRFIKDFQVLPRLLKGGLENGERMATNFTQLMEILHKVQVEKKYTTLELIGWLKRGISGGEVEGEEFEQRMESDEEAIRIVTIHKSKGLEYNIVFAPTLDFTSGGNFAFCSFRDEGGNYFTRERSLLTDDQKKWMKVQVEQENRRLLYVAVTRAVYKCYINKHTQSFFNNSSLAFFVRALEVSPSALIDFSPSPRLMSGAREQDAAASVLPHSVEAKNFGRNLSQRGWRRLSYTALAAKQNSFPKTVESVPLEDYEAFIFRTLPKGSKTGTMLHEILEVVDFTSPREWPKVIGEVVQRYKVKEEDLYRKMLAVFLEHLTEVRIRVGAQELQLDSIDHKRRINEFEFDFNVSPFAPAELNRLSSKKVQVMVKAERELEGVMNGKMDMFFEWGGRYYILDWKSNFLGMTLEDYTEEMLVEVMNDHNYHLQYLIYSLAAKKYLESRLGDTFDFREHFGGVIYLFLRGLRKDLATGVFTARPSLEQLEELDRIFNSVETLI